MDLETLTAFTLTDGHRRQLAVWKQVKNEYYGVSHHTVRRLLTEKSIAATSKLGRFVGAEAYEQVGERLGIDFAAHWRPTADNYWGRVKKAHALEVGTAVLGTRWGRDHAKDKKPVLAKALEAAFAGDATATLGLDPETSARAGAWVPPGMAYGASHDEVLPAEADDADEPDRIDADPDSDTETVPAFLTADSSLAEAETSQA